jgi:hypothetical protein
MRLDGPTYNSNVVSVIPALIPMVGTPWAVLPPGVHQARLDEVQIVFATNPSRRALFDGLVKGSRLLLSAGCPTIWIDGSYVTGKPRPADFDACWDPNGVNPAALDRVFLDFSNGRRAQKAAFGGEFFPSSAISAGVGKSFIEFFQFDRFTGKEKGIISISLSTDPVLIRKVQP